MTTNLPETSAVALPHWGLIRARGADAASFLHGQLTQDVLNLGPDEARLAGYCSAKGRLLASFVMWKPNAEDVLLACHASVLAATLKRLSMFVMRAKCQLTDATADVEWLGVCGDPARQATAGLQPWGRGEFAGANWIRLPDASGTARAWRMTERAGDQALQVPPDIAALQRWQRLEVESGIPVIEAATVDRFVPQMLNYELIGAVNFQKGCYPGQEVVARSQYRATAKRRAFLFTCDARAVAGQEVFHSADAAQPAGMVVNAAELTHAAGQAASCVALVEVKLSALDGGALHLGAADGAPLTRLPMPYDVPTAVDGETGTAT
ncbi:MAG: hypothetical protein B7Y51_06170 [Burkholderiales bacterium 28-67-8]|nr:MAG: hypothetical protein B7Y51_06170 [Burkholderiales bacterium 28-67-8]